MIPKIPTQSRRTPRAATCLVIVAVAMVAGWAFTVL
jgi:hypothetical protein